MMEDVEDLSDAEEIEEMKDIKAEVQQNQSLSERFRKELEGYLNEMDAKTGSEGEALIDVPENFDAIVGAMTRDDLEGKAKKGEDQPWYEYIIQDHVNKKMDKDFKGRYYNLMENSEEAHIRKGMAEILMLDRQLWMLSKKSQIMANDEARSVPSTPGTGRHYQDRTFMTMKGSAPSPPSGSSSSRRSARPKSALRSERLSSRQVPQSPRATADGEISPHNHRENDIGEEDGIDGDSKYVKMSAQEQKKRLEELLSWDDSNLEDTLPFYSPDFETKTTEIDQRLEEFGHLDRLQDVKTMEADLQQLNNKDYLTQQRWERKQAMHAAKIDQMLNACGSQLFVEDLADDDHPLSSQRSRIDLDLPALVAMTARTPNTIPGSPSTLQTASRSQLNPHLHLVPTRIEDIRPDIPITREDIVQLVHNLRPNKSRGNSRVSRRPSRSIAEEADFEIDDDVADNDAVYHRSNNNNNNNNNNAAEDNEDEEGSHDLTIDPDLRVRIDNLLQDFAGDIQRLQRLRASAEISAKLVAGESLFHTPGDSLQSRGGSRNGNTSNSSGNSSRLLSADGSNGKSTVSQGGSHESGGKSSSANAKNERAKPNTLQRPQPQQYQARGKSSVQEAVGARSVDNNSNVNSNNRAKKQARKTGATTFAAALANNDEDIVHGDLNNDCVENSQPSDADTIGAAFSPSDLQALQQDFFPRSNKLTSHRHFGDESTFADEDAVKGTLLEADFSSSSSAKKSKAESEVPFHWMRASYEQDQELEDLERRQQEQRAAVHAQQQAHALRWEAMLQKQAQQERDEEAKGPVQTLQRKEIDFEVEGGSDDEALSDLEDRAIAAFQQQLRRQEQEERQHAQFKVREGETEGSEDHEEGRRSNSGSAQKTRLHLPRIPSASAEHDVARLIHSREIQQAMRSQNPRVQQRPRSHETTKKKQPQAQQHAQQPSNSGSGQPNGATGSSHGHGTSSRSSQQPARGQASPKKTTASTKEALVNQVRQFLEV